MDTCSTLEILFFMSTVGNGHHVQKEPIDLYKKNSRRKCTETSIHDVM